MVLRQWPRRRSEVCQGAYLHAATSCFLGDGRNSCSARIEYMYIYIYIYIYILHANSLARTPFVCLVFVVSYVYFMLRCSICGRRHTTAR